MVKTLCLSVTTLGVSLLSISLFEIVLLIPLLYHGVIGSVKSTLPKSFKILYYCTCFIIFIAGISFPMQMLMEYTFSGYCNNFTRIFIMVPVSFGSYLLSLVCIGILYFCRFLISFNSTHESLTPSKILITFIITIILSEIILLIITVYANQIVWFRIAHETAQPTDYRRIFQAYLAFSMTNFSFNIFLLILFIHKVYQIGKMIKITQNKIDNIKTLIHLIHPILVYALCLFFAIISSLITTFYGYTREWLYVDTNNTYQIHITLIIWDTFINCLSLNLQFTHTHKLFGTCCGVCYKHLMLRLVHKILHKNNEKFNNCVKSIIFDTLNREVETSDIVTFTTLATTNDLTTIDTYYSNYYNKQNMEKKVNVMDIIQSDSNKLKSNRNTTSGSLSTSALPKLIKSVTTMTKL